MALIAAIAAALTAVFASVALAGSGTSGWVPPSPLVAMAMVPGLVLARRRASAYAASERVGKVALVLGGLGVLGMLVVNIFEPVDLGDAGGPALAAAAGLGLVWPDPRYLRASILAGAGSLVAAGGAWTDAALVVAGVLGAAGLGLVATMRHDARRSPHLGEGSTPVRGEGRRSGAEAAALVLVVALLAGLLASVIPEPESPGGGARLGEGPEPARPVNPFPLGGGEGALDITEPRGPFPDEVAFRVSSPADELWRATAFDRFDGRSWTRTLAESVVTPGSGGRLFVPRVGGSATETERLDQRFTLEAPFAAVLPGAAWSRFADVPSGARVDLDATMHPQRPLGSGAKWRVSSERPLGPPARPGRPADPRQPLGGDEGIYQGFVAPYLPAPPLSRPVANLAAELMSGGRRPSGRPLPWRSGSGPTCRPAWRRAPWRRAAM